MDFVDDSTALLVSLELFIAVLIQLTIFFSVREDFVVLVDCVLEHERKFIC